MRILIAACLLCGAAAAHKIYTYTGAACSYNGSIHPFTGVTGQSRAGA